MSVAQQTMVASRKWEKFEKAGFLPFIREHEKKGTSWKKRVALWERKFGTRRSIGSLRGHLNRCILEGLHPKDKTARSDSPPANITMQAKTAKHTQRVILHQPQQSPDMEKPCPERQSVWSVPSNPEPSTVPVLEASPTPPSRSSRTSMPDTIEKEPSVPMVKEEVAERLKYCLAFCKCWPNVYSQKCEIDEESVVAYRATVMRSLPPSPHRLPSSHIPSRYYIAPARSTHVR